jgi:tRNA(Arg) A34 adenosine deaminase TadA
MAAPPSADPMALALAEPSGGRATGAGRHRAGGRASAVLAQAGNRVEGCADRTAHAEMLAIRAAAAPVAPSAWKGPTSTTPSNPARCVPISFARIRRLYFGAYDPKGGGVEHGARFFAQATCHHRPEVYGGIAETQAAKLLQDFFRDRR